MKNKQLLLPKILLIFGLFFMIPNQVEAQFLKKLKQKAEKKIEREAEKRAERRMNKKIDKQFDKAEDVLDGKKKNSKKGEKSENGNANQNSQGNNSNNQNASQENTNTVKKPNVVWSKFDFIPGDEVIFEDSPSSDEENGEFPSRWDLYKGGAEIAEFDGEPVIMFLDDGAYIIPFLKNSNEDYLPEVFTIEMDVWFGEEQDYKRYWVGLHDVKNQRSNQTNKLVISPNGLEYGASEKRYPGRENVNWGVIMEPSWRHISIAFTKGKFKAYMDDTRLINIPRLEGDPTGITIISEPGAYNYIKNIRIAKGGVKYYDRVLSEGKIVVNGIKFDVNKATLKPESMGPINKIYELMQKNSEINFSVEGHTDSDGDDASNMTLSKARGKSVMNKLIEMGISANRLKSDGFGESKPIDNNSTPEGKANNRRVEFVKFSGSTSTTSNTSNSNSNSSSKFDELDKKSIAIKLETLPDSFKIPVSNNSGIVNGVGTVLVYATSDGNLGKMEILDVDKDNNYKLTVKYVTYNYNGSIHSQSNNLQIKGTYTCDLDKGTTENVIESEKDFWYQKSNKNTTAINSTDTTILKVLK
jgi:outer membrane protein OmpA-like peptidoglycan-associated protein